MRNGQLSNANEFLKELYARLDSQNDYYQGQISVADFTDNAFAKMFIEQYKPFLPKDKNHSAPFS